jgi:multidrug resistance efflux pump
MRKYKLIIFGLLLFVVQHSCKSLSEDDTEKAGLVQGTKIIETGELAAVDSRSFVLQRYGRRWYEMKVIGLLKHGSIVKAGDSIIQLDPTEIKKRIIDLEGELESQIASLAKTMVDHDNRRISLESNMKNEIATFDLRKLELESSRFESAKTREISQLQFNQAQIAFEKTKKLAELNKVREASELKIQKIRVEQLKNELQSAYDILPELTIRTPISGIFQVADNRRTKSMIKVGDEIYAGTNMGNVPDLTWMKVNTTVSENDFMKIYMGQKVNIRLDALPKVVFEAEVSFISKLCRLKDAKSRQKVFDLEVNVLKPDERLKPGMTVSCEFILN